MNQAGCKCTDKHAVQVRLQMAQILTDANMITSVVEVVGIC